MGHALFSQDGFYREGFWEVVGHLLTFPELSLLGGGLLVLCSSSGPPVKTTHAYGYYGAWPGPAVSVNVHPLTVLLYCVGWVCHPCRR